MRLERRSTFARVVGGIVLGVLLLAPVLGDTAHGQGPILKSQKVCPPATNGECLKFSYADQPPPVLRSITLQAPGPGAALVLVNGSGFCSNEYDFINDVVLETQIVRDADADPSYKGLGGLLFVMTLPPYAATTTSGNAAVPINLSSSRVFSIASAGTHQFFFKLALRYMPDYTWCALYGDTMSVLFIPN